jgi:DNA-directed RNA polymerase alpha subunit
VVTEETIEEKDDKKKDKVKEETVAIEDLKLPARTASVLEDNKITTVNQLKEMTEVNLLDLDGMGEKGVKEIRKAIGGLGVILKAEEK